MKWTVPQLGLAVGCLCGLLAPATGCRPAPSHRPNVVLFVVDTLRADAIGPYGNVETQTPHLDAFAADAILFENAFASSSWTRPSMASLFTGLHPHHHGVMGMKDGLAAPVATLAEVFATHGYATGYVTAHPSAGSAFGFGQGFDHVSQLFGVERKRPVRTAAMIADSTGVVNHGLGWARGAGRPFFLTLLSIDPHAPYSPPARFDRYGEAYDGPIDGRLESVRSSDLDAADRARIRALYAGEVAFTDASFGILLEHLAAWGELENTIVVFTADHGEEFWEYGRRGHGNSLVDLLIRVPLMIRAPSGVGAGERIARPVQLVDLAPSLLELAGLPIPDSMDGQPLLSESGERAPVLSSLFYGRSRLRSAREYPWKLVRDERKDVDFLYDVRQEGAPIDPMAFPEAAATRDRLAAALDSHSAEPAVATDRPAIDGPLRDALRELGYVDRPGL